MFDRGGGGLFSLLTWPFCGGGRNCVGARGNPVGFGDTARLNGLFDARLIFILLGPDTGTGRRSIAVGTDVSVK